MLTDLKILLIEDNPQALELIKNTLSAYFGAKVSDVKDYDQALTLIKNNQYSLIISRAYINQEESVRELLNGIYDAQIEVPILILGEIDFKGIKYVTIPEKFDLEELVYTTRKSLNLTLKDIEILNQAEFSPIKIKQFLTLKKAPTDIYIKLTKNNKYEFIKRIRFNDDIDFEVIKKYKKAGVLNLYIKSLDKELFLKEYLQQYYLSLNSKKSEDELFDIRSKSYDLNKFLIEEAGINDQVMQMSQAAIKSMTKSIVQHNLLGALLKNILTKKSSFAFKHSYLIAVFSSVCIESQDWHDKKDVEKEIEKITFAAFFHDILLTNDKLVQINSKLKLYESELDEAELKSVKEHANKTASLLQEVREVPLGVEQIVREHHGMRNGIGFTENFTSSLSPRSIFFIVIEEFVSKMLEFNSNFKSFSQIFDHLYDKFPLPSYRKITDSLMASLNHKLK